LTDLKKKVKKPISNLVTIRVKVIGEKTKHFLKMVVAGEESVDVDVHGGH
jgi:hypothetical protein